MAVLPKFESMIVCDGINCDFNSIGKLIEVLTTNIFILATYFAVAAFMYAGFLLLTSQGDEGALAKAKKIFGSVLKGYIWILAAWIVVYTITNTLLGDGYSFLGNIK